MRPTPFLLCALAALTACGLEGAALLSAPAAAEGIPVQSTVPSSAAPGSCWGTDVTPARFETVTERVLVAPAGLSPDGSGLTEAVYRTETLQSILEDRREVWFQTPCERDLTPDAIATLQRALAARGLYDGPANGEMTPATRTAIRAYQAPLGLDSAVLSLVAARALGLAAIRLPGPNPEG